MNPYQRILLRNLEAQIETECRFILIAGELLKQANALPMYPVEALTPSRAERIQFAARSIVIAVANIAKLAWGNGSGKAADKKRRYQERQELRDELGLVDDCFINQVNLRNDFEHIDERLEGHRGSISIGGVSLGVPEDQIMAMGDPFGHYFRETGRIIFWAKGKKHEVSVPDVVAEAQRLLLAIESLRRNRHGVIPHAEWLALVAEPEPADPQAPPPEPPRGE